MKILTLALKIQPLHKSQKIQLSDLHQSIIGTNSYQGLPESEV